MFNKDDFLYVPFQIIFFLIKQVAFREGMDITHEGIQYFLPLGPRSPTSPHCGGTGDLGPREIIEMWSPTGGPFFNKMEVPDR